MNEPKSWKWSELRDKSFYELKVIPANIWFVSNQKFYKKKDLINNYVETRNISLCLFNLKLCLIVCKKPGVAAIVKFLEQLQRTRNV